MPTKIGKCWLRFWQVIKPIRQLTVKCLFGHVSARIEWIERMRKAIVKDRETRNLIPEEIV
jgi:hypothetical protein